jgi:hypothetical protein
MVMSQQQSRRRPARRVRVAAWLVIGACIVIAAVVLLSPSPPPSPVQQCVASIRAQPPGEVTGYTPACMRLTLTQRTAAIRQAQG